MAVSTTEPAIPTADQVVKGYKKYTPMTAQEVDVNPFFALLCVGVTKEAVEKAKLKTGPHTNSTILVYMNAIAAEAFRTKARSYPVGAVVVKEKKMHGYHESAGSGKWVKVPERGLGGMIKREPGFDPGNDNWEYFYSEDDKPMAKGALANCIQCHQAAKATGYVFGGWNKKERPY